MVKQTRKYIERGMRDAAEEAGNKGRSMTHDAMNRATTKGGELLKLFCTLIEANMPRSRGEGSRIVTSHVEVAFKQMEAAMLRAIALESLIGEEEE